MGVALAVKVTAGDPIYCVEEKEKEREVRQRNVRREEKEREGE